MPDLAQTRMMKHKKESEVLRSGTERGMNSTKTTKPKPTMPKTKSKSKTVRAV